MKITMPVTITASDAESRIIAGRIVQWDSVGNTSAGQTVFLPNSITFNDFWRLSMVQQVEQLSTGYPQSLDERVFCHECQHSCMVEQRQSMPAGLSIHDTTSKLGILVVPLPIFSSVEDLYSITGNLPALAA